MVDEADSVNSVTASACHTGGPKGVSPGQKALLHGIGPAKIILGEKSSNFTVEIGSFLTNFLTFDHQLTKPLRLKAMKIRVV